MTDRPAVSAIMPVLNEERHLREAVEGVLAQRYPGRLELVLAVGPSRDRTLEIAHEIAARDPRVLVVDNPTGRTPDALNAAIGASHHEYVVRVDAHSVLPPHYIDTAVALLAETGADNVGGLMWAEGRTPFESAVARAMTSKFGVGNSRFHTGGHPGPADTVYLGVFRRSALERVGGYDTHYTRAQDWEMNYRIRRTGGLVWFTPELKVIYRPRDSLTALARQYFHYGRWRRVVMAQHPGSLTVRYLAPPAALVAVSGGTALGLLGRRVGWLLPGAYALGVVGASVLTGRGLPREGKAALPAVYATMHLAWGAGFLSSPRRLRVTLRDEAAAAAGRGPVAT